MNLDTIGRRSRYKRCRTGKRIVLTARDLGILKLLYRYRYLRQSQLIAFLQPKSQKRFIERLGDLYHETGLINRPAKQWRLMNARSTPLIYELSARGIDLLKQNYCIPHRATTLSRRNRSGVTIQFTHAMMIVDALVAIEQETSRQTDQRFVPVDEILARAPEKTKSAPNPLAIPVTIRPKPEYPMIKSDWHTHIIPDALYGIEYLLDGKKLYRFWALECEHTSPDFRSSLTNSSKLRKQAAYDALLETKAFRTHWGIPNLAVQFVS